MRIGVGVAHGVVWGAEMWARWTTRRGDACTLFPFGDHVGHARGLTCTKLHLLLHVLCPALEAVCVQLRQI
jgi:hypothetical protein